jgi:protease I
MRQPDLTDKRVAILVAEGFEQSELETPLRALDDAGATTRIVSPSEGRVRAWHRREWGPEFPVDVLLEEVEPGELDALLVPGGVMSPDRLRRCERAVELARQLLTSGRPVASICHGPQLLIDADGVRGKRLTSHPAIRRDLENAGATWLDAEVVVDGNLVTSRRPADLPAFVPKMLELFSREASG